MKAKRALIALVLAAALLGCGKQIEKSRHLVILIDISGSIEPRAKEQAFKAIDQLVGEMHRGDKIAVIPITGDAQVQTPGRIIHFEVPINRQAYDSDLRGFRAKLATSLEELKTAAVADPGAKTDILGSIALAGQEFQLETSSDTKLLAILSDFIQDDANFNFTTDPRLNNRAFTKIFAIQVAQDGACNFRGMRVYLGLMRSNEYAKMSRTRRQRIQEFWVHYFTSVGGQPRFVTDGPELLRTLQ
jgi:hypothetical protein